MKKLLILLVVFFLAPGYTTGSVYADSTVIQTAVTNTTATGGYSDTNYQNIAEPNTAMLPSYEEYGWITFDTLPVGNITDINFSTEGNACTPYPQTLTFYPILEAWNPTTLTHNTSPAYGTERFSITQTSGSIEYFTLATDALSNAPYGFRVAITGSNPAGYCTFEQNNLTTTITYSTITPTPTPTPTITPTPTPVASPSAWFDIPITLSDGQYMWADYLYDYNPALWISPSNLLGYPDRIYATITGVGYPNLFVEFPRLKPFPWAYGNLKALKLVLVGNGYGNLMVRPAINHSPVCIAQSVILNGYSYYTFEVTACPALKAEYLYQRGAQGSQVTYYIGSSSNSGNIDAIGMLPIFDNSPSWVATSSAAGDTQTGNQLEVCDRTDLMCQMRNWFTSTIGSWFKVDIQYAVNSYESLLNLAYSKSPWAYINAILTIDISPSTYTPPGIVPDFEIDALNMTTYSGPDNSIETINEYLPAVVIPGTTYTQWYNAIIALRSGILVIFIFGELFAIYKLLETL